MAQSVPLPSVPKLSFGNGIIDLSDVPAVPRKATGIDALMDKFVKQVGPKTAVSNESAAPEQMDLHGSKLETKAKIGHKLVMLKQQLLGKIKQKRREEQLQREAAWREEHPEEVEEENVEEVEESEGEETTSESEEEEVEVEKSPLKLKNPFADDEESTAEVESDLGKNKEISNERPDDSFSGCNAALSGLDSQFLPVTQQPPVASLTRGPINFADLGFDDRSSREISPTANASFQQTDDLHLRLSLDTETLNCDDLSSTPTQPTTSSVPFTNVKQSLAALIDDHDDSSNSQSNQDLMQVCSGRFPTQTQQLPMQSSLDKVDEQLEDDSIEEETELEDEDEKEEGEESEIEGDQADIEDENGGDSSDEEMELVKQIRDRQSSSGVPKPMAPLINLTAKRKDRNAFFDTEAELSGSEAESDENEDVSGGILMQ